MFVIQDRPTDKPWWQDDMTVHPTCPLCGARKAKRECPALGRVICAVCCGTKRLTEIPCPDSCSYLTAARTHPAATVQRRHERDLRFFLPLVADLTEPQSRLVLLFQAVLLRHAAQAIPAVLDPDVAEGCGGSRRDAGDGAQGRHLRARAGVGSGAAARSRVAAGADRAGPACGADRQAGGGCRRTRCAESRRGARTAAEALDGR